MDKYFLPLSISAEGNTSKPSSIDLANVVLVSLSLNVVILLIVEIGYPDGTFLLSVSSLANSNSSLVELQRYAPLM